MPRNIYVAVIIIGIFVVILGGVLLFLTVTTQNPDEGIKYAKDMGIFIAPVIILTGLGFCIVGYAIKQED